MLPFQTEGQAADEGLALPMTMLAASAWGVTMVGHSWALASVHTAVSGPGSGTAGAVHRQVRLAVRSTERASTMSSGKCGRSGAGSMWGPAATPSQVLNRTPVGVLDTGLVMMRVTRQTWSATAAVAA